MMQHLDPARLLPASRLLKVHKAISASERMAAWLSTTPGVRFWIGAPYWNYNGQLVDLFIEFTPAPKYAALCQQVGKGYHWDRSGRYPQVAYPADAQVGELAYFTLTWGKNEWGPGLGNGEGLTPRAAFECAFQILGPDFAHTWLVVWRYAYSTIPGREHLMDRTWERIPFADLIPFDLTPPPAAPPAPAPKVRVEVKEPAAPAVVISPRQLVLF